MDIATFQSLDPTVIAVRILFKELITEMVLYEYRLFIVNMLQLR